MPGSDQIGDIRISYECLEGFGAREGPQVVALGRQSPMKKRYATYGTAASLRRMSSNVKALLDYGGMTKEAFIQKHGK